MSIQHDQDRSRSQWRSCGYLPLVQVADEVLLGAELAEQRLVLDVLDAALLGLGDLVCVHIESVLINYTLLRRYFDKYVAIPL